MVNDLPEGFDLSGVQRAVRAQVESKMGNLGPSSFEESCYTLAKAIGVFIREESARQQVETVEAIRLELAQGGMLAKIAREAKE